MKKQALKEALFKHCQSQLAVRRAAVDNILKNVALSLKEETKSSAGDKHETGRAMLQLERENAGKQLAEIEKLEAILQRVSTAISSGPVHLGSAVMTSQHNYFISIPAGQITVDGTLFFAIGATSPIGQRLLSKEEGDEIRFRESVFTITSVF
ncbi:3-oxoacyl-ACP synthase [uncultured Dokdonia sp.]|uniref:3-oxoacyl-ACP synthase n=1 Tax=uncultured Dokdonia sp. TaxID=575653 RepID=UPI00261E2D79|nr:3-oxoacyl-ACP synthase [uncultured Dokdonia sp.]